MGINFFIKYKFVLILWASFFLLPTFLFSQTTTTGNISGIVKTDKNEKLPFCLVYLLDQEKYSALC